MFAIASDVLLETTAQTLTKTFYHIIENPDVLSRLRVELEQAMPDTMQMPSLATLQNLPYLNAVVDEGVRISFPVPARSPRIFEDRVLQYEKWTIKPGVRPPQAYISFHLTTLKDFSFDVALDGHNE
jgi:cytochrome P450